MSLPEHVAWGLLLSLVVFLVYNALRVESPVAAARQGIRRWLVFLGGTLVLALILHLVAEAL
jgi:hypothetical protein